MTYSLINVFRERDGFVDGNWIQDFVGTLEEATQCARDTEKANGGRISVAVVEGIYDSPGILASKYGLLRLDVDSSLRSLDDRLDDAVDRSGSMKDNNRERDLDMI